MFHFSRRLNTLSIDFLTPTLVVYEKVAVPVKSEAPPRLLEPKRTMSLNIRVKLEDFQIVDGNPARAYIKQALDMGLLDFIQTADPRKVRVVEVQKGVDQVKLMESTKHCFMSLKTPAAGGSSFTVVAEVPAPTKEGQENTAQEDAYLELADPDEGTAAAGQVEEEVVVEQPKRVKKRRLVKQSETLPAKRLREDHLRLVSGTGGKTLAGMEQIMPVGSRLPERVQPVSSSPAPSPQEREGLLDSPAQTNLRILDTVESSGVLSVPVVTTTTATTSTKAATASKTASDVNPNLAGPSQPEESEGSHDSFYEPATVDPFEAKRWYVPKWSITNDSLLDDAFCCRTLVDCIAPPAFFSDLWSEVRSRAKHELELKEKLKFKYDAHGKLLKERDLEILELKSKLAEKETEVEEAIRLRDQNHDISLLDSRSASLASRLENANVACTEVGNKITSLASERDRLISEVSSLHAGFYDFKKRMEVHQEKQAQELYNHDAELEVHVMDVSDHLEGEFYPTYLTTLAGRRWLLTYGIQLALLKCLKSSKYQGILGHALGRAVDFGMQAGLEAGHEHGTAGRSLFVVDAYNPKAAKASYIDAVKALEGVDFPLVNLLKSKKDAGMDEVMDCFLLDGPLADLPKAAHLQPCIEQLSFPIHHAGDTTTVRETSLSFALMNIRARAAGAKKHVVALRQLMVDIVSALLSS
ncbi:hypothetical protein Tco_0632355 [Tanacetum coccineum]